jgi:hypothetical protein
MKTVLLVAAALFGWAAYAHAGDGYSDPSDFRAPGVAVPASAVTTVMSASDPFGMRAPGVTSGTSDVTIVMSASDPFGMRTHGATYGNPGGQLARHATASVPPKAAE